MNLETTSNNESMAGKDKVSEGPSQEREVTANISD